MAFGITSIISKQSGVAEVINHAFKIDFWDTDLWVETINHLIENPQKRVKMGIDGMHEVTGSNGTKLPRRSDFYIPALWPNIYVRHEA
ncbi:MAG: glycosyltransferase [Candidatus Cloacimonetes bacterium]|nr:glycosyltransferase [Candidatus Cloacimonadota bacterium]